MRSFEDNPYTDKERGESFEDYCDRKKEELEFATDAYMMARYREQAQLMDYIREN